MKFSMEIDMDGVTFVHYPMSELAAELRKVASKVEVFLDPFGVTSILDGNGNRIGTWEVSGGSVD